MSEKEAVNLILNWGTWGKMGLDEYIQMQIDTVLPDSKTFCDVIGNHIDWDKIKEDVDATGEAMAEEGEELAEATAEKIGVGQVAVEQAIQPYVWNGKLNCDNWKESPMFSDPKFEKTLSSVDKSGDLLYKDSIDGFIAYYCPGLRNRNPSVTVANCADGIKAACGIT